MWGDACKCGLGGECGGKHVGMDWEANVEGCMWGDVCGGAGRSYMGCRGLHGVHGGA